MEGIQYKTPLDLQTKLGALEGAALYASPRVSNIQSGPMPPPSILARLETVEQRLNSLEEGFRSFAGLTDDRLRRIEQALGL